MPPSFQRREILVLNIDLEIRKSLLKVYAWSTAFHEVEAEQQDHQKKRLEKFEMWCYQKLLRVKWADEVKIG